MPPHDSPKSGPAARLLSGRRPAFSETIRPHPTAETRQKARRAHRQWSGETRTKPHANDSKTIEDEIAKTRTRHSLPLTRRRMAADRPGRSVCISYRIICVRPFRRTGMLASRAATNERRRYESDQIAERHSAQHFGHFPMDVGKRGAYFAQALLLAELAGNSRAGRSRRPAFRPFPRSGSRRRTTSPRPGPSKGSSLPPCPGRFRARRRFSVRAGYPPKTVAGYARRRRSG